MMPGMSGVQTLEVIHRENLDKDTAIIALTADAIVGARETYIKEGFSDYLSKPVMYEALEEMLIRYLDPSLVEKEAVTGKSRGNDENEQDDDKPIIIAVSQSPDKLRAIKEMLGGSYKGVFVKDMDSAAKFVEKNRT